MDFTGAPCGLQGHKEQKPQGYPSLVLTLAPLTDCVSKPWKNLMKNRIDHSQKKCIKIVYILGFGPSRNWMQNNCSPREISGTFTASRKWRNSIRRNLAIMVSFGHPFPRKTHTTAGRCPIFRRFFLHSQAVPLRFECLDHTGHNPATGMAFSGKQLAPGQHSSANAAATLCKWWQKWYHHHP